MSEQVPAVPAIPDDICDLYHLLSTSRRCYTIQLLATRDDRALSVRTLAKGITALEHDIPVDQATGAPYENVYTTLIQTHLPALADANIIEYDADRNSKVATGSAFGAALLVLAITQTTFETLQKHSLSPSDDPTDSMTD